MKEKPQRFDWWLFLITLALLGFGIVIVFDASYPHAITFYDDKAYWVKRQIAWAVVGVGAMLFGANVGFWKWRNLGTVVMAGCVILLLAVFAVGHGALGAQRWIGFGPVKVQPSEFAKLGIILFLAQHLAANPRLALSLYPGLTPLLVVAGVTILLVERQPDLGTAITLLLTTLIVIFAAGARKRWVAGILGVCAVLALAAVLHKGTDSYRWKRVITFMNPELDARDSGYQITHSTIALGSGGMTGIGFGESREKLVGNLPMQRTDFIFAIVGEEFGLLGTGGVIIGFALLAGRGFWIAARTKDTFGSLLATGITGMITIQAILNIGVVTASIPATGIPLPFLSYGGSSLLVTLFGIGILLNISRHPERQDMRPSARRAREKGAASLNDDWRTSSRALAGSRGSAG